MFSFIQKKLNLKMARAAAMDDLPKAKKLVELGASGDSTDEEGNSARIIALSVENYEIYNLLNNIKKYLWQEIEKAREEGNFRRVKKLKKRLEQEII